MTEASKREQAIATYVQILATFCAGSVRFWGAEAAYSRLTLALLEYRRESRGDAPPDGPFVDVLNNLHKIAYTSYDALAYVTDLSHLVYVTTLLDTFLTDTTLFLLLLHPQSIGKNQQVSLASILGASSTYQVLTEAAAKKARELSYLSFADRCEYLRETFGLKTDLDEETNRALRHFPNLRNAAVHDQGIFELLLDEAGSVASRVKTCPVHPTRITPDDVESAARAYQSVFVAVATAVMTQCLKYPDNPALVAIVQAMTAVSGRPGSESS